MGRVSPLIAHLAGCNVGVNVERLPSVVCRHRGHHRDVLLLQQPNKTVSSIQASLGKESMPVAQRIGNACMGSGVPFGNDPAACKLNRPGALQHACTQLCRLGGLGRAGHCWCSRHVTVSCSLSASFRRKVPHRPAGQLALKIPQATWTSAFTKEPSVRRLSRTGPCCSLMHHMSSTLIRRALTLAVSPTKPCFSSDGLGAL